MFTGLDRTGHTVEMLLIKNLQICSKLSATDPRKNIVGICREQTFRGNNNEKQKCREARISGSNRIRCRWQVGRLHI